MYMDDIKLFAKFKKNWKTLYRQGGYIITI